MKYSCLILGLVALVPLAAKDVMLMNRIGPSASELYIANADGSGEKKLLPNPALDYNASFSPDGRWIVFTSERDGAGQADIYRVHLDGSGMERLTSETSMDDQGVLSPDGTQLAFVSSRGTRKANIWILNLKTKRFRNLTAAPEIQGDPVKPDGFFRPAWSPDGNWIAFTSDRNTEWRGHDGTAGWEHTQLLSIYVVQPDGKGFQRLTQGSLSTGSPKWSPDGTRIVFYEIDPEKTFAARMQMAATVTSQIASIDVATGARTEHTTGPGLKVEPQYVSASKIGYLVKAGKQEGLVIADASNKDAQPAPLMGNLRSPSWSPDGKQVVYERRSFAPRAQNELLYSWDENYEYRYTGWFPAFSKDGQLAITDLSMQIGNPQASISVMNADGSHKKQVFNDPKGAAFSPSWSPDGKSLVFGWGGFFQARTAAPGKIMTVGAEGGPAKELTSGFPNAGFPDWSPDGKWIVYRVWGGEERGLRLMNLADHSVRVLTTGYDNVPFFSPSGDRILFTRRANGEFDIYTVKADGTDVKQLTKAPGNDAHGMWTNDGRDITFSSSRFGFKDEAALYDNSPQPFAALFTMKADGSEQRPLTDSRWEDAMAKYVPHKEQLRSSK
jgi:Tol biopolymer transport system component